MTIFGGRDFKKAKEITRVGPGILIRKDTGAFSLLSLPTLREGYMSNSEKTPICEAGSQPASDTDLLAPGSSTWISDF